MAEATQTRMVSGADTLIEALRSLGCRSPSGCPVCTTCRSLVESGFPELTLSRSTFGLAGPAGMPEDVVAALEDALRTAHDDPSVVEQVGDRYIIEDFQDADALEEILDRAQEVYEPILQP